jgi:hypothetical protein
MTEQTYSMDKDLQEAAAMLKAFVPYIYEDELYGRLGFNLPSLTPGALLMRLRRLRALSSQLNDPQRTTLEQLETQHQALRKEWGVAYEKKLGREIEARLRDLDAYFKESDDDPRQAANAYLPEALRRTMVAEAVTALSDASAVEMKVRKTDATLRRYLRPCPFIWDTALQPAYPQDTFWWLYNRPQPPEKP